MKKRPWTSQIILLINLQKETGDMYFKSEYNRAWAFPCVTVNNTTSASGLSVLYDLWRKQATIKQA